MYGYSRNKVGEYSLIRRLIEAFGHLGIWAFGEYLRNGIIVLFPANTYLHTNTQKDMKTERNILWKKNCSSSLRYSYLAFNWQY